MENTQGKSEPVKGVTPNHVALYQKIAIHSDKIFEILLQLLDSRNENIRLGAAKVLVNKILPDKKTVEVGGLNGEPIKFNIIFGNGYIPPNLQPTTTPEGNIVSGQPPIQNNSMASQGKKDDNGGNGVDQASTG